MEDDQFPASIVSSMLRASLRKNSFINQEPLWQLVLPVIDGVSLLVEQMHDKLSQKHSKQFW